MTAPQIWDASASYTASVVRDICVEMSIGLHPWEKHEQRKQRVLVSVALYAKRDSFEGAQQRTIGTGRRAAYGF